MSLAKKSNLVIMAVGDVHVNRQDPASAFSGVMSIMKQGGINLGNLEAPMCV